MEYEDFTVGNYRMVRTGTKLSMLYLGNDKERTNEMGKIEGKKARFFDIHNEAQILVYNLSENYDNVYGIGMNRNTRDELVILHAAIVNGAFMLIYDESLSDGVVQVFYKEDRPTIYRDYDERMYGFRGGKIPDDFGNHDPLHERLITSLNTEGVKVRKMYSEQLLEEYYKIRDNWSELKQRISDYRFNKTGSHEDGRYCVSISVTDLLKWMDELEGKNE